MVSRDKRKMADACMSSFCRKAKTRNCSLFTEETRTKSFRNFWKMTWDMKKVYVSPLIVTIIPKEKKTQKDESRRGFTYDYFLYKENTRLQVCKKTFLNTLGIKQWMAINFSNTSNNDKTCISQELKRTPTKSRQTATGASAKQFMKKWLNDIPKLESHYCRASTSKRYLEPIYLSKMDVYRQYKIACVSEKKKILGQTLFFDEMNSQNIALYQPKIKCDLCIAHSLGHIDDDTYQHHQIRKNDAEKKKDKEFCERNNDNLVLTVDVQSVLLSPKLQASALYYKTKVCVHNYTVYNLTSKYVTCYLWHEGNGGLDANIFASMITNYLESEMNKNPSLKTITIYSDSCGYQNKNNLLANALLWFSRQKNIIIYQKFLEKEHTQMEVDAVHSLIERKLKGRDIYLPTDYVSVCVEARRSHPFQVKYLSFDFFRNFAGLSYYASIRPGARRGDPTIAEIVALKYGKDIQYKLKFNEEWKNLPKKIITSEPKYLPQLYKKCLKIKNEKYQHLQELKKVIPNHAWSFYDNLDH